MQARAGAFASSALPDSYLTGFCGRGRRRLAAAAGRGGCGCGCRELDINQVLLRKKRINSAQILERAMTSVAQELTAMGSRKQSSLDWWDSNRVKEKTVLRWND